MGAAASVAPEVESFLDMPQGSSPSMWIRGEILREPVSTPSGSRFELRIDAVRPRDEWVPVAAHMEVRMASSPPAPNWFAGTSVELFSALRGDRPSANPGSAKHDRLRVRGIDVRATLKHHSQVRIRSPPPASVIGSVRDRIRDAIGDHQESGLLRALLLGERDDVPDAMWQILDRAGVLHLLAISGLHVGILIATVHVVTRLCGGTPQLSRLGALAVSLLIPVFVEPRAPVRRANSSATIYLLARLVGARLRGIDCVALATTLQLVKSPISVFDLGFQLTTAASVGLALAFDTGRRPAAFSALVRTSATAQLWVLPLIALTAAKLQPLAVVANLVAVPALSIALPVALISVGLNTVTPASVSVFAGPVASAQVAMINATDSLIDAVRTFAELAGDVLPVIAAPAFTWTHAGAYWAGLLLTVTSNRSARRLGAVTATLTVALALRPPIPYEPRLVAFDVGQGDAVLVETPRGAVLYDAGGYPGVDYDVGYHVLAPQLRRRGISRLDFLAISHFHADHAAGSLGVMKSVATSEVWVGSTPPGHPTQASVLAAARALDATSFAPFGLLQRAGCAWDPLTPDPEGLLEGARGVSNHASLALLARCGRYGVLLAGDADVAAEAGWLGAARGRMFATTVLKVGHHGSDTSTSAALLEALRPRHAMISVGIRNPWQLPRDDVLRRLRARGISVYRTDRDGAITVRLADRVRVTAERWVRARY